MITKRNDLIRLIFILLTLLFFSLTTTFAFTNCGIQPIKPIVPVGCRDLVALCTCDNSGNNCKWEWVCVK